MRSARRDRMRSTPPGHRNHLALRTFTPKTNLKPTSFGHISCIPATSAAATKQRRKQ